jgi:hypothetical protein
MEVIDDLMNGIPVKNTGFEIQRKVHFNNIPNLRNHWAIGRAESNTLDEFKEVKNHFVFKLHHDLSNF